MINILDKAKKINNLSEGLESMLGIYRDFMFGSSLPDNCESNEKVESKNCLTNEIEMFLDRAIELLREAHKTMIYVNKETGVNDGPTRKEN